MRSDRDEIKPTKLKPRSAVIAAKGSQRKGPGAIPGLFNLNTRFAFSSHGGPRGDRLV
jgi:hypothetical protein